jgi:hypothetical protein
VVRCYKGTRFDGSFPASRCAKRTLRARLPVLLYSLTARRNFLPANLHFRLGRSRPPVEGQRPRRLLSRRGRMLLPRATLDGSEFVWPAPSTLRRRSDLLFCLERLPFRGLLSAGTAQTSSLDRWHSLVSRRRPHGLLADRSRLLRLLLRDSTPRRSPHRLPHQPVFTSNNHCRLSAAKCLSWTSAQLSRLRIAHYFLTAFWTFESCDKVDQRRGCRGIAPYSVTEKLSCNAAVELFPTQTSNSEGSTTQPFFAALQ